MSSGAPVPALPSRFEEFVGEPAVAMEAICVAVADGGKLVDVARSSGINYKRLAAWVRDDAARLAQYRQAQSLRADPMFEQCLDIAAALDGEDVDPVARAKVQIDTLMKTATAWDRTFYGPSVKIEREVNVNLDAGLLLGMGRLLSLVAAAPRERVIEHTPDEDADFGPV